MARSRTRAYLAGPYSAYGLVSVQDNIDRAKGIAEALWSQGYAVLCPHLNSAHMEKVASYEDFLEGGLEWLRVAEVVVLVPEWESSPGTLVELEEAYKHNILVYEWDKNNPISPFILMSEKRFNALQSR